MTNKSLGRDGPHSRSRRNFLTSVGATVATINTAACIRKPYERILPFSQRPEDLVPGNPLYYSTATNFGGSVLGLLACSMDGRPTKVEGNPGHPLSLGATNTWAQASVLELYDPDRSRNALIGDKPATSNSLSAYLGEFKAAADKAQGKGLAILVDDTPSPTLERLLSDVRTTWPQAKLYRADNLGEDNARAGAEMVGLKDMAWTVTGQPGLIATFDADPLGTEGDNVAFTRAYAKGRSPEHEGDAAGRLYSAEPVLTVTGSNADHRKAVRATEIPNLLAGVAYHLRASGMSLPELPVPDAARDDAWVKALAEDLAARPRGSTVVLVGERQPAPVHALGFLINQALGNFGPSIAFTERNWLEADSLGALAAASAAGEVSHLIVLGGNPVFDAAGDIPVSEIFEKVSETIHLGLYRDETGRLAKCHVAKSHYLETWGDLVARDGTVSIQQPLIAPLYESMSAIELLSQILGGTDKGYELVRATYGVAGEASEDFDKRWATWLHNGVASKQFSIVRSANPVQLPASWNPSPSEEGLEVNFVVDTAVLDGRMGNSPWLQELPDPISKLTWDNAAYISSATAQKLRVESGDFIRVSHHDVKLDIPVWIQPGTADGVIVLPIGYGRLHGGKFAAAGFDVSPLRLAAAPWVLTGAKAARTGRSYELACTQVETSMYGRPLARGATKADFADDPDFVDKFEVMPADELHTMMWDEPFKETQHRWGMTIDLNSCSGCGACTVACQAENNIPWVGKEEVLKGREMHWIRIDRYVEPGPSGDIEVKYQPVNCQQCETAPCENVCPVAATVHSPEGMNDMVYNRCIGTRYCSNNCPYKVRRFNFFHYTVRNDADYGLGIAMQRNPDVTVRYRGVMEKCSYCVQRVVRARIDSKVNRDGIVRDGEAVTACAQVCPADAIAFGNLNEETSRVAKESKDPRNYSILAELNTRPRTTYLARLTNPNPKLANG